MNIEFILSMIARQIELAEFLMDWQQLEFLMKLYTEMTKFQTEN